MLFGPVASSTKGPFFTSRTAGDQYSLDLPLSNTDSLGITYTLSRTTTVYPLSSTVTVPGVTIGTFDRRFPAAHWGRWARDTGNERVLFSNSASGGWLGGGENMVRTTAEYSRIFRDPFFTPRALGFSNDV